MEIEISVPTGSAYGAADWLGPLGEAAAVGGRGTVLLGWIQSGVKLGLQVQFYLPPEGAAGLEMEVAVTEVTEVLIEAACGPADVRARGAVGSLFWQIIASKRVSTPGRIVVRVVLL